MTQPTENAIPSSEIEAFRATLRGELLEPSSPGYDATRVVWNAMIDRRPALIARCRNAADVVQSVNFARDHRLVLAVRSGDRKSTRLNSSHIQKSRMPSSA